MTSCPTLLQVVFEGSWPRRFQSVLRVPWVSPPLLFLLHLPPPPVLPTPLRTLLLDVSAVLGLGIVSLYCFPCAQQCAHIPSTDFSADVVVSEEAEQNIENCTLRRPRCVFSMLTAIPQLWTT